MSKDSLRVQAYGAIDELNTALGWALTQIADREMAVIVTRLQNDLMVAGADLAAPQPTDNASASNFAIIPRLRAEHTRRLEEEIDRFEAELIPLTNFILPGGGPAGAALHMARAICRRAERHLVALSHAEPIDSETIRYINRLSDHLFTLARLANQRVGVVEQIWSRGTADGNGG